MFKENPLNFAVVREDPLIESTLVRRHGSRRVLLVASGGCTALSLRASFPDLHLTLVDPNPAQLRHVERKARAWESGADLAGFNVGDTAPDGLNACGNFESLFRSLRNFVCDYILPEDELERLLTDKATLRGAISRLFSHRYWAPAFDLHFGDSLLNAMFGPEATRHAPKGSYPGYFRAVFECGLGAEGATSNPFLHHVFLSKYVNRPDSLPEYLKGPRLPARLELHEGTFDTVPDLEGYDLIALSNVFDWMSREAVARTAARLARETRPGTIVVFRQLNNHADFADLFGDSFTFDAAEAARLLAADRSLFYGKLNIGARKENDR